MGTVILAEDDEGVRRMMRVLLVHFGHFVIETANGREAALACEASVLVVDLVIVDMQMPHVNGRELVDLLLVRTPSARVLVCSGDEGIPGLPYLSKPFTPQTLRSAVDAALAGPSLAELMRQRDFSVSPSPHR